jgi:hypothetical protein
MRLSSPRILALVLGLVLATACGDDPAKPPVDAAGGEVGTAGSLPTGNRFGSDSGDVGEGGTGSPGGGTAGETSGSAGEGELPVGGAPAATCNDGKGAVISGRVLAPNGALPLGGVSVYVPSATVDVLPSGTGCWRCDSALVGVPIAKTVTSADGRFELTQVPAGDRVPLVVQTGKWRRQLELEVRACEDNPAPEADTRLPRKQSEGNLPAIALVSGGEDTLECLLRKLGIDDSEFTYDSNNARVRLYQGKAGIAQLAGVAMSTLTPAATLWSDPERLSVFDLLLLGSETDPNAAAKPAEALAAVHDYAVAGGRVLLQHHQSYFLSAGSDDVSSIATYSPQASLPEPFTLTVDEGSARGKALAEALLASEASATRGKLSVTGGVNGVQAVKAPATRLLYGDATVQAFSLDLPSDGGKPACGRLTETEILTGAGDVVADFPSGCSSQGMSAQERALAYLIFDLGACLP